MAIAVMDDGRVANAQAYGLRNAAGDPLQGDTACTARDRRCVLLAHDVRADAGFADRVRFVPSLPCGCGMLP